MRNLNNLLLASVCALSLLAGCGRKGDPGPSGQNLTGNIVGFVSAFDEAGNVLPKAGVSVTVDGVTPAITATSDASGHYELPTVRNGTYNLSYTRADLSTYRQLSVAHVGGDQPTYLGAATLTQASSTRASNLTAVASPATGSAFLQFNLTNSVLGAGANKRYVIYIGSSASVTSATGLLYDNTTYYASANTLAETLTRAKLNALGFATGTPVYAIIYGLAWNYSTYTDPATGRIMFSGLSATPSNAAAFIVP